MVDTKRDVQLNLKISKSDFSGIADLKTTLLQAKTALDEVSGSFNKLGSAKLPSNFDTFTKSLKELSKIDLPKVKQMAEGIQKLSETKKLPSLTPFVNELKKFKDIDVPSIKQLGEGIKIISELKTTGMSKTVRALNAIRAAITQFEKSPKLPAISSLADGLVKLKEIDLRGFSSKLTSISKSISVFEKSPKLPAISSLVNGITKLKELELDGLSSKLSKIALAVTAFAKSPKLPALTSLATGITKLKEVNLDGLSSKLNSISKSISVFEKSPKLPAISALVTGVEKLKSLTLGQIQSKLTNIASAITVFEKSPKFPSISALVSGITKLKDLKLDGLSSKLSDIALAMKAFEKIPKLPSITALVNGIKALKQVGLGGSGANGISAKLQELAQAMAAFKNTPKLPAMSSFANGIKKIMDLNINDVKSKIQALAKAIYDLDKQGKLDSLKNLSKSLGNLSTVLNASKGDLKSAVNSLKSLGEVSEGTVGRIRTLGEAFKKYFLYRIVADSVFQLKQALRAGLDTIIDFDQGLKDIQAITRATAASMYQLQNSLVQVASNTKFSLTEIAEGMRIIGQSGFSAGESVEVMAGAANLATGTLSTMSSTIDLMTTTLRVYNLEASRAGEVSDVFANAVSKSKLSIDKLQTSMQYVGDITENANISYKDSAAALMILADSGLRASKIGTGLRQVISQIIDPSDKMKEALAKAGLTVDALDPKVNSFADILDNLKLVLSDSSIAFDLFGKRGATAALALANNADKYRQAVTSLSEYGTASKMASVQAEGLGISLKNLRDRLGVLVVAISNNGFTEALRKMADGLRVVIQAATDFVNTRFGSAFAIATGVVVAFTAVIGTASVAVIGFGTALAMLKAKLMIVSFSAFIVEIGKMIMLVKAGALSLGSFATWITGAVGPVAALAAIIATLVAGLAVFVISMVKSGETAEKISHKYAELADSYKKLSKAVQDYRVDTSVLDEDSKEHLEANKKLRAELIEVASSYSGVSEEAKAVLATIDPLTGKMVDATGVLDAYTKKLNELELKSLEMSLSASFDAMDASVGHTTQLFNQFKQSIKDAFSGSLETGKAARELESLVNSVREGSASFEELARYLASIPYEKQNAQQKEMSKGLDNLVEATNKYITSQVKAGSLSWDSSQQSIEKVAKELGYITDFDLSVFIYQFEKLAEINNAYVNQLERWEKEQKDINANLDDNKKSLSEWVAENEHAKEVLGEVGIAAIKAFEDQKKAIVDSKNALVDSTEVLLKNAKTDEERYNISKDFYAKLAVLEKQFTEVRLAENRDRSVHTAKLLESDFKNYENALKNNAELYKDNLDLKAKYDQKALDELMMKLDRFGKDQVPAEIILFDTENAERKLKDYFNKLREEVEILAGSGRLTINEASEELERLSQQEADALLRLYQAAFNSEGLKEEAENGGKEAIKIVKRYLDLKTKSFKNADKERLEALKKAYKEQELVYETHIESLKSAHIQYLSDIDKSESENVITHSQNQALKTQASLKFLQDQIVLAKQHRDQVVDDTEEWKKRDKVVLDSQQELYKKIADYQKEYADGFRDTKKDYAEYFESVQEEAKEYASKLIDIENTKNEKIIQINKDADDKIAKSKRDLADKIADIDENLAKKRESIAENLTDKLAKLDQELVDSKKSLNSDLSSIDDKIEDAITSVRNKGLSEAERNANNYAAAVNKLTAAEKALSSARRNNDSDELKRGKELLNQVVSLAGGLDNVMYATDLLRKAQLQLKDARSVEGYLKELEIEKKKKEEIAEAAKKEAKAEEEATKKRIKAQEELTRKLQDIEKVRQEQIKSAEVVASKAIQVENIRHLKEMQDLQKEKLEILKKILLYERLKKLVESIDTNPNSSTSSNTSKAPNPRGSSSPCSDPESLKKTKENLDGVKKSSDAVADSMDKINKSSLKDIEKEARELLGAFTEGNTDELNNIEELLKKTLNLDPIDTTPITQPMENAVKSVKKSSSIIKSEIRIDDDGKEYIHFYDEQSKALEKIGQMAVEAGRSINKIPNVSDAAVEIFSDMIAANEKLGKPVPEYPFISNIKDTGQYATESRRYVDDLVNGLKNLEKPFNMTAVSKKLRLSDEEIRAINDSFETITKDITFEVMLDKQSLKEAVGLVEAIPETVTDISVPLKVNPESIKQVQTEINNATKNIEAPVSITPETTKLQKVMSDFEAGKSSVIVELEPDDEKLQERIARYERNGINYVVKAKTDEFENKVKTAVERVKKDLESISNTSINVDVKSSGIDTTSIENAKDKTNELLEKTKDYNKIISNVADNLKRIDGSNKGPGYLGSILTSDGKVMTEVSIGVTIANKEVEIPLIIPSTTRNELKVIEKIAKGDISPSDVPNDLFQKAVDHAISRLNEGLSAFKEGIFDTESEISIDLNEKSIEKVEKDVKSIKENLESISDVEVKPVVKVKGSASPVDTIDNTVAGIKTKLESISNTLIEVLVKVLNMDKVDELASKLNQLKDKTITITTNYRSTGDSPKGYQVGGRLPGFGGGDRRPLLAEDGEWIIRKEAVRKYGDSLFDALNSLRYSIPKFKTGGSVGDDNLSNSLSSLSKFTIPDIQISNKPKVVSANPILQDFGKVILSTGNMSVPALVKQDVISEINTHLRRSRLMGRN